MIATRRSGSSSSRSQASARRHSTSGLKALRFSGRLMVIVRTCWSRSTSTAGSATYWCLARKHREHLQVMLVSPGNNDAGRLVCAPVRTATDQRPNGATALSARSTRRPEATRDKAMFAGVLTMLLAMGWAANHFAALLPAISLHQHLSAAALDVMFGIYAVGLLPGLLLGGRASDRLGRASVALAGSTTALVGTIAMLVSQHADVLLVGRLIVGIGVGL